MKVNLDNGRYKPEEEIRTNTSPYKAYYECLSHTFDFNNITSVCDVGCATGHLLYFLKKYKGVKVKGYEYFSYHKDSEHCNKDIKDSIEIYDIRDPLPDDVDKYSLVNCTEVGEHLEARYASTLIENVKKLSSKYIIFTWSEHDDKSKGEDMMQHLNPMSIPKYEALMSSHGLKHNKELTNKFVNSSLTASSTGFYYWWRTSLRVYEL
tara:strand:+ start:523 stop:1146 length:624 start_codon:yes stop_codon:yes gene_type:complete